MTERSQRGGAGASGREEEGEGVWESSCGVRCMITPDKKPTP
jgi:hypothetical protein